MKRGIFVLLVMLLVLPAAYAGVNIDVPDERYNLGDTIELSGSISEDTTVTGYFKLSVNCGEDSFLMQLVPININGGVEMRFPDNLKVPPLAVISAMDGNCSVMGEVVSGEEVIDRGFSESFEVTKALDGKFTLRETLIQVGSIISIVGEVAKLNKEPVSGVADVYFSHGDSRYLIEVISVEDGFFNYSYTTTATPAGSYSIDIVVHELYGNEMLFEDVASFELVNEFSVIASVSSRKLYPGETLEISGEARNVRQALVPSASVTIMIDGIGFPTTLSKGIFSYSIDFPENVKSGKHSIEISIEDDIGNRGSAVRYVEIIPVPTELKAGVPEDGVVPGKEVTLTPALYDQAGDIIDTLVGVRIMEGRREVLGTTVSSGEELSVLVPELTPPGEWEVRLKALDMEAREKFTIVEHYLLDAEVEGNMLVISNVGNVKHSGRLEIGVLKDEVEGKFSLRKTIRPGEDYELNLGAKLDTGIYSLFIPTGDGTKRIDDVDVTKVMFAFDKEYLYYFLVLVAVVLLAVLLFIGWRKVRGRPTTEEYHGRRRPPAPGTEKSALQKELESPDIEDFKKRMLDSIRETEPEQSHKSSYLERRKAEKKKVGGFKNMFG